MISPHYGKERVIETINNQGYFKMNILSDCILGIGPVYGFALYVAYVVLHKLCKAMFKRYRNLPVFLSWQARMSFRPKFYHYR